jgi:acetolactate synthase I/II/III large subunit
MNGAESLIRTLIAGGVEVCFANLGTSEMHVLAALDRIPGIRSVLGLFEGVVTGAADGYARMAGKPAVTLLHLGPGLANGLANLHNARRARSAVVNVIGDHATHHHGLNSPLESDVEAVARPFSDWVRSARTPPEVGRAAAAAIAAARSAPGQIASLIVPGNAAWDEGGEPVTTPPAAVGPGAVPDERIAAVARLLQSGAPCLLFMTGTALGAAGLAAAGRIAEATGATPLAQMSNARVERGAGRVPIDRLRYPVDQALEQLAGFRHVILIGTREPAAFFAYPGKPSRLMPEGAAVHRLAGPEDDLVGALEQLAERVGAPRQAAPVAGLELPAAPTGRLTGDKIALALAAVMPENAIVADESVSVGRNFAALTRSARPHSWLQVTGARSAAACRSRPARRSPARTVR